jgi:hypothetical protein
MDRSVTTFDNVRIRRLWDPEKVIRPRLEVALALGSLAVAACTSTHKPGALAGTNTTVPSAITTPTETPAVSATTTTIPTGPRGPGYTAARAQWLGQGLVGGGAAQNIPFALALAELQSGESTDPGNRTGYPAAMAILKNLTGFPDANVSAAQSAQFDHWSAQLNAFFNTPAATQSESCFQNITAQSKDAAKLWAQEPTGTAKGISVGPLEQAAADLEQAPADTPCYAAAIDDLVKLESATRAEIAATSVLTAPQSQDTMLVGGRITYLNLFFETDGAVSPYWSGVLHS